MQQVIRLRDTGQEEISRHALFDWLSNDKVSARDRLAVAPAGASFSCSSGT